jgi:hypothetical protein
MLKITSRKILSLCVLGVCATTLVGFAQEPNATPKVDEVAALVLPAENVAITGIDGRTITVTVLSMAADKLSIVVRTKDGAEMPILMSKLNAATLEKINGRKATLSPQDKHKARSKEIRAEEINLINIRKGMQLSPMVKKGISGAEMLTLYFENDRNNAVFLMEKTYWLAQLREKLSNDIDREKNNFPAYALIEKIEIQKGDEVVSLRPQFEALGVKAGQQSGNTCALFATQHLLQYSCLKDGGKPPTRNQLEAAYKADGGTIIDGTFDTYGLLKAGEKSYGKKAQVQWLELLNDAVLTNGALNVELIKNELRKGRACLGTTSDNPKGTHSVVIVGFKTQGAETQFEYLNSNGISNDKGYRFIASHLIGAEYSMWFE